MMPAMKIRRTLLAALVATPAAAVEFVIRVDDSQLRESLSGRALVILSTDDATEPRFQVRSSVSSMQVFGIDFEGLAPGAHVVVGGAVSGWPVRALADLPAGEYWVQGLVNRYEEFELANGKTVLLPPERGEGQRWNAKPGNPYSTPRRLRVDPASEERIEIVLDQVIPPIEPPADTRYIRHVRMRSERLSEFWGRDVHLGAHVLVPEGFDDHPEARYPLMVFHGHFPADFGGFRSEPPDPDLECEYSERFQVDCYNRIEQEEAYALYQQWIAPDFPRYLVIEIQHANPYYDDSYAVNSENLGPYGDAITYELVPFIEERFRGLGEPWARFLYGGSTGGWEALAAQVLYPDEYNGCFAACPDPIDFRDYMTVDIYEDENAYFERGPFGSVLRPGHRNWLGHVGATIQGFNHYELALGTRNRSGDQFDIWEAVYSPQSEDGYPRRLWDKESGEIDPEVAAFWRESYDLGHILRRDWKTLGPKLVGKIHIYCGDMDNYYLNNAVYRVEEFLEGTTDPYYAGEVDYGDRAEHCWNGDHENGNHISRLRYNTMYLPRILERIEESAPPGADLASWRH
jgi:hypothetical protein